MLPSEKAEQLTRLRALVDGVEDRADREAIGVVPSSAEERRLEERAREYALRALTASARSRAQLADGLRRREIPDDVAAAVLDRFTEVGLIDDAEYARTLARTRFAERALSRRAIAAELRAKGLDQAALDEAIDQIDDEQELEAARQLVRARLSRTRGLGRDVRMRRAVGVLGRKGYAPSLAVRLVTEALSAEEPDGTGLPEDQG